MLKPTRPTYSPMVSLWSLWKRIKNKVRSWWTWCHLMTLSVNAFEITIFIITFGMPLLTAVQIMRTVRSMLLQSINPFLCGDKVKIIWIKYYAHVRTKVIFKTHEQTKEYDACMHLCIIQLSITCRSTWATSSLLRTLSRCNDPSLKWTMNEVNVGNIDMRALSKYL